MENILILNLLGKRFRIPYTLVIDYPQTLLGNKILLSKYYRHNTKDYYFERNPLLFPYILTYYTLEKKILCPYHIPIKLMEDECKFFQLENSIIYPELNRLETYHYFQKDKLLISDHINDSMALIIAILFMITASMEKRNTNPSSMTWSLSYFVEIFSTILLTLNFLYQIIYQNRFNYRNKHFLLDLFCNLLTLFIITGENLIVIKNYYFLYDWLMLLKTFRLLIIVGHLRVLRLIVMAFIQRFRTICLLIFINVIIVGSFSEIAFAFERRQKEDQTNRLTMKTHLDAFWWSISLSFTIGFGYTDPHSSLTMGGRICSYILIFFGLLFNGLILQELIKGFLKIYREERKDE